ncbi:MAG: hypothetical protein DSZ30_05955 [Aquificaceae bacterium]|nr:MAG: hypothetical protein DSZ30_05955 [Aquificaceae bacterium]
MGILKVEIPGEFEVTIKAKDFDEAIEKIKEIKIREILKLVGSIEDRKTWKETKKEIEEEIYDFPG